MYRSSLRSKGFLTQMFLIEWRTFSNVQRVYFNDFSKRFTVSFTLSSPRIPKSNCCQQLVYLLIKVALIIIQSTKKSRVVITYAAD